MSYRGELWKREIDHEADGTAEVRLELQVEVESDGLETVHVTYELFSSMLTQLGWRNASDEL